MSYTKRIGRALAMLAVVFAAACAATPNSDRPTAEIRTDASTATSLPPGVLPRSVILTRNRPPHPGFTVRAKLVTLASLTAADPELTQCATRGCAPGQLVWLVLEQGPPGYFTEMGLRPPPTPPTWSLFPVNATTGVGRGDTETGGGTLANTAWGKLRDLAG